MPYYSIILLLSIGRFHHVKRLRFVVLCQLHLFRQGGTRLSRWPSQLPAGGSPRFFYRQNQGKMMEKKGFNQGGKRDLELIYAETN